MPLFLLIILIILGIYFLVFFVLARLVIPFYGFKQYVLPTGIPQEIKDTITQLEQKAHSQQEYLKIVYDFVQQHWQAQRLKTILALPLAFRTDLKQIWQNQGYSHCVTINLITFILLAKSQYFQEKDIKVRYAFFNLVLHQYLKVRVNKKWIALDPSVTYAHLPIGKHAQWFG
ncbi:MAG: hypothetical protein NTV62_02540 [Candidatus Gribaldobacteria bacterium]|nr:hypothetical protein [Candidatus Gribaldobacteria bacterium]